ncbi:SDR family oxidoreductase [Variovorax sp. CCNWLW225]|uniref:dTDP-4-dehydrorhamnose reductase family protein n=1 Tax=Variovorax sp. CCNWLW225 TaxID=3127462 RepID=UPI003076E100
MKVLILGATGMLGHAMLRRLAELPGIDAYGTVRAGSAADRLPSFIASRLLAGVDVTDADMLSSVLDKLRPEVVVNCVGVVKQQVSANDPLVVLPINAMLPHRLSRLARMVGARVVHFSTDCVFDGSQGRYTEADRCDAQDLYGRSKLLGELHAPHTITLRTSIVGPELASAHGLLEWFLSQEGPVKGFRRALFSGLTTVELADVVGRYVLPRPDLRGVYHVSAAPISKFDLLALFARTYGHDIAIEPADEPVIDRSLDGSSFHSATGYIAPSWKDMIEQMRKVFP